MAVSLLSGLAPRWESRPLLGGLFQVSQQTLDIGSVVQQVCQIGKGLIVSKQRHQRLQQQQALPGNKTKGLCQLQEEDGWSHQPPVRNPVGQGLDKLVSMGHCVRAPLYHNCSKMPNIIAVSFTVECQSED
jgi:hypothetical protein